MANNQVVAMWGSPGSGTTVTSVKIACELAKQKYNVVLMLCDDVTPMVPLIAPSTRNNDSLGKSLGNLLKQPKLTQISIFQHLIPVGQTLSLLGYQFGENEITYGDYDLKRAQELIAMLRNTADFVVIDCFHQMIVNNLSAAALECADVVLRVLNADPKSLIYLKSQKSYLLEDEDRFHYNRHVNIINNILPIQAANAYEDAIGGHAYRLPHLDSINRQFIEGQLLESLPGRDSGQYESVIKKIVKEEILNE